MDKIAHRINKLFEKHRIVFWYDEKKELRDKYGSLRLGNPLFEEIAHLHCNKRSAAQVSQRALATPPKAGGAMTCKRCGWCRCGSSLRG